MLLTRLTQYRGRKVDNLKQAMRGDVVVDLRNVYEQDLMENAGLRYTSVGR